MDLKELNTQAIELLAQHEEAISGLYKTFSKLDPDHKSLWNELSWDEIAHAGWIRKLHPRVKDGTISFAKNRFGEDQINKSTDYMKGQLALAEAEGISPGQALAIAFNIENNMLENKFFEVFKGDHVELERTLLFLSSSTKEHRDAVKKALDEAI